MSFDLATWGMPLAVMVVGSVGAIALSQRLGGTAQDQQAVAKQQRQDALEQRKAQALAALHGLEMQRDSMLPADYQAEREALLARGADAMRELETGISGTTAPSPERSALVAALTKLRADSGDQAFKAALAQVAPELGTHAPARVGDAWRGAGYMLLAVSLVGGLAFFATQNSVERGTGGTMTGKQDLSVPGTAQPSEAPDWVAQERAILQKRLDENANDVDAINGMTQLSLSAQDLGAAMQHNAKALELEPANADALTYRAVLSALVGNEASAMEQLAKVLEANVDHPKALTYQGLIALQLGQLELAEASLDRVLSLYGDNEMLRASRDRARQMRASGGGPAAAGSPAAPGAGSPASMAAPDEVLASGTLSFGGPLPPDAQLFISLRSPQGGPPIAAVKLPIGSFPYAFTIKGSDVIAMGGAGRPVPGAFTLTARVDLDGDPLTKEPSAPGITQPDVTRGATDLALTLALP